MMTLEMFPAFAGHSGLSEDQLLSLWERVEEKWPAAFNVLSGPIREMDRDEATGYDMPIYNVIDERYPQIEDWRDRYDIYLDMKLIWGWQRVRTILERGCILDIDDYWSARNSSGAFGEQLSIAHQQRLSQLVFECDPARLASPTR